MWGHRVEPSAFTKISTLGVEEQRVNVRIDLLSPREQWAGLGDGYRVDTRIIVYAQDDVEIVPAGALFRRGDRWSVSDLIPPTSSSTTTTAAPVGTHSYPRVRCPVKGVVTPSSFMPFDALCGPL